MRIAAFAIGALVVCTAPAFAQEFTTGVKGGVNLAKVSFEAPDDTLTLDWRIGVVAGGFVRFPLFSWLDLQPEALYTMKGGKRDEDGVTSSVKLEYFEVPVLARMPIGNAGRYFVVVGPYKAVRLRAKSRAEFNGSTEELDIADQVDRFDFGLAAGGGAEFGSLVIDARYSFGLRDIDADTSDEVKAKNRVLSFTIGVRF